MRLALKALFPGPSDRYFAPALVIALYSSEFSSFIFFIRLSQVVLDIPRVFLTIVMACLPRFIFIRMILCVLEHDYGRYVKF